MPSAGEHLLPVSSSLQGGCLLEEQDIQDFQSWKREYQARQSQRSADRSRTALVLCATQAAGSGAEMLSGHRSSHPVPLRKHN